jgi:hypothetical protein
VIDNYLHKKTGASNSGFFMPIQFREGRSFNRFSPPFIQSGCPLIQRITPAIHSGFSCLLACFYFANK